MMKKAIHSQTREHSLISFAQYLTRVTTQQDIWDEVGKALLSFFDADLVGVGESRPDGGIAVHHWRFSDRGLNETWLGSFEPIGQADASQQTVGLEVRETIAETLQSGFLASRLFSTPEPLSLVFLPVSQESRVTAVLLVGHRSSDPCPKALLNIYLAVVGLIGTIASRLASERELEQHRHHLETLVTARTAELTAANEQLEQEITKRQQAEDRLEHLNRVLRAASSINQLIGREQDRDRMLQVACDTLIQTRGYYNAWIALLDQAGLVVFSAQAGLGEDSPLLAQFGRGELPACGQKALAQAEVVVAADPPSDCVGCPVATSYLGRAGMTVRLEYGGKAYGLLCASIASYLIMDKEQQALFQEIGRDIAFALHELEMEMDRKRAEVRLRTKNAELEAALAKVKQLSGLVPICSGCKKIRDDQNYWHQVEIYISKHSEARFSHGLCPDCIKRYFPGLEEDIPPVS